MKLYISAALAGLIVMWTVPVQAHHSNVTFYFMDRTVEITGVMVEIKLVNPHGRLKVEVTNPSGEKVIWTIDCPNATGMRQRGWTTTSVAPGEVVKIVGNPARNPDAHGMYGQKVIRADGTVLPLGTTG